MKLLNFIKGILNFLIQDILNIFQRKDDLRWIKIFLYFTFFLFIIKVILMILGFFKEIIAI